MHVFVRMFALMYGRQGISPHASSCRCDSRLETRELAASYRRRGLTCLRLHILNMWDPADPAPEAEGVAPAEAWRRM